jgi:hypothetical protein
MATFTTKQNKTVTASPSLSFCSLLTLLFIGLKLTHVIAWSWWLVLLPTYGPIVFLVTIALICGLGAVLFS